MVLRNYINGAPQLNLQALVDTDDVTLTVSSTSGYPNVPFTISLERGTPNEEVCLATAKTATTFTVTRGWDGTTGKTHQVGAIIEHSTTAADYRDANAHVYDTARNDHTQYALKSLWAAKGSIPVATGAATPANVTVGANGTVMIADSTQASGVRWGLVDAASLGSATSGAQAQAGDLKASIISGNHNGWLALNGQTVVNAQSLHPALWAVAPSAWKSGSNLVLPNAADTVLAGVGSIYSTLGVLAENNTEPITINNMPRHDHTMVHGHTVGSGATLGQSGIQSATHHHLPNTLTASTPNSSHAHAAPWGAFLVRGPGNGVNWDVMFTGAVGPAAVLEYGATATDGAHTHTITGQTSIEQSNHRHAVDINNFTGNTGFAGTSPVTELPITQRGLPVNIFVKT